MKKAWKIKGKYRENLVEVKNREKIKKKEKKIPGKILWIWENTKKLEKPGK